LTASILTGFALGRIRIACPPLAEFHHRAGIFSLSFQGLVAAGMPSCKPKNLHVPIKMNTEAEFFAAVIAAHIRGWAQTVASGR
jgi:hypothetical protein